MPPYQAEMAGAKRRLGGTLTRGAADAFLLAVQALDRTGNLGLLDWPMASGQGFGQLLKQLISNLAASAAQIRILCAGR